MKECKVFAIAFFHLILGTGAQPSNPNKLDVQELEDLLQEGPQILKSIDSFVTRIDILALRYHNGCNALKEALLNENYVIQSIILKMRKYYISESYELLIEYVKQRNKNLKHLSTKDLNGLDDWNLEARLNRKFHKWYKQVDRNKDYLLQFGRKVHDFKEGIIKELQNYYEKEMQVLGNVRSFITERNTHPSVKLTDKEEIINILYVTWSVFWMTMHFRVCSIYSNFSNTFHHKKMCESYLRAMMRAFYFFKSEIKATGFYQRKFQRTLHFIPKDKTDIYFVINELLQLSFDFVLNKDTLKEKKSPDLYESKIIKYNEITEIKVGEAMYKTVFPTDLTIQELTEMKKRDEDSIILKDVYYAFNQKLSKVIDGGKAEEIEHFFMKNVFDVKSSLLHTEEITWFNLFYFETETWNKLRETEFNIDIHESGWEKKVIYLIEWFQKSDRNVFVRRLLLLKFRTMLLERI